jgi:beta-galactosidase
MNKRIFFGSGLLCIFFFGSFLVSIPKNGERKWDFLYEIKSHNGTPTLFIDGKSSFYGTWWMAAPEAENWIRSDFARENAAETGIHIYAFDVGRNEWIGPAEGRTNHYDFSSVGARYQHILDIDPDARFHLRIYLEMHEGFRKWWHDLYPDEVEVCSDGTTYRQSFASQVWREQAKDFLSAYIHYLQKIGLAERIVSYQVGAGHTGFMISCIFSRMTRRPWNLVAG